MLCIHFSCQLSMAGCHVIQALGGFGSCLRCRGCERPCGGRIAERCSDAWPKRRVCFTIETGLRMPMFENFVASMGLNIYVDATFSIVQLPIRLTLKTSSRISLLHSQFEEGTIVACHAQSDAAYAPSDTRIVTPTTNISRTSEEMGEARAEREEACTEQL